MVFSDPDDAAIDPVSVSGSGQTYELGFDYQTTAGNYTLRIGADVADVAGNLMETAWAEAILLLPDLVAPRVVGFSPVGRTNQDVSALSLYFSETLLDGSFEQSDITITGPGGPLAPQQFEISPLSETAYEIGIPV